MATDADHPFLVYAQLINGPNLNLLGTREPEKYGSQTLSDVITQCQSTCSELGLHLETFQSNHEGHIIDRIHAVLGRAQSTFLVMNPGAFTHTSVAIRDAISGVQVPVIEVHITNVHKREAFRHHSYISDIAVGVVAGFGTYGYEAAIRLAAQHLLSSSNKA